MRDELDTITNRGKEDRLIITSMVNATPMPVVFDQKKEWLYFMVGEMLNRIKPEEASKLVRDNQGRNLQEGNSNGKSQNG